MKEKFKKLADYVFTEEFQDKAVRYGFIAFAILEVSAVLYYYIF